MRTLTSHPTQSLFESLCKRVGVQPDRAVQFAQFAAVGGTGSIVNMAVFGVSIKLGVWYLAAGCLAFTAAVSHNFLGNYVVTFDRPAGRLHVQYLQFVAVSLGGFVIYSTALAVWIGGLGVPPLVGNVLAIAPAGVWNFVGADEFAFDRDASLTEAAAKNLNRAVHLLYRGRVKAAVRGTVVYDAVYRLYAAALAALLPDTLKYTAADTTIAMDTSRGPEAVSIMHTIRKEDPVLQQYASEIQPGDVVWDVGANLGVYTALATASGAKTVAVEPYAPTADRIPDNVALTASRAAVTVAAVALGADADTAELAVERAESGTQTPGFEPRESGCTTTVKVVSGDSKAGTDWPAPDVLKIDVEGHEHAVLEGLSDTLADVRVVYVEAHGRAEADDLRHQLHRAGFRVETLHSYRGETHLRAYQ